MRISTKGLYALRLMLDIALNSDGNAVPLRGVAERQDISDKYLEQIVTQLSRAGLVRSVRGATGGYLLTRDTSQYTVGDILRPMEGDLAPVECVSTGCCDRLDRCVAVEVWQRIGSAVDAVVDGVTLEDLVQRYYEKSSAAAPGVPV